MCPIREWCGSHTSLGNGGKRQPILGRHGPKPPRQGRRIVATGGAAAGNARRRGTRGKGCVESCELPRQGQRDGCLAIGANLANHGIWRNRVPLPLPGQLSRAHVFHGFRGGRVPRPPLHPWLQSVAPHGAKVNFASAATCALKTDETRIAQVPYEEIRRTEVIVEHFLRSTNCQTPKASARASVGETVTHKLPLSLGKIGKLSLSISL